MDGWTHEEYKEAIKQCLMQRQFSFTLDTTDCPPGDDLKLLDWAHQDGYSAALVDGGVEINLLFRRSNTN